MKSKILIILVIASHFAQVIKGKIKMIIRITIISKLRIFYTSITIHTNLDHNLSSISHSHFIKLISSNELLNIKSFNKYKIFIKNIQKIIQDFIIKTLTIRDKKKKNENFIINLLIIFIIIKYFVNINIIFSFFSFFISFFIIFQYILSH